MKYAVLTFILLFIAFRAIIAQSTGFYYKYDFQHYLHSKTHDPDNYLKRLQETITYPPFARENLVEGRLSFYLINNGNNHSEIVLKRFGLRSEEQNVKEVFFPYNLFEQGVTLAFEIVDAELLRNNEEKFITEFSIRFEMEGSSSFSDVMNNVDLVIKGKRTKPITTKSH